MAAAKEGGLEEVVKTMESAGCLQASDGEKNVEEGMEEKGHCKVTEEGFRLTPVPSPPTSVTENRTQSSRAITPNHGNGVLFSSHKASLIRIHAKNLAPKPSLPQDS